MKPSGKILEEITIESSVGLAETIEKLRLQQGPCSDEDSLGCRWWFECSKKGKFHFTNGSGKYANIPYYAEGYVFEQDGKTLVKIYLLRSGFAFFDRWFAVIYSALFITFICIYSLITKQLISKENIFVLVFYGLLTITTAQNTKRRQNNKDFDLGVMKNEIIERVEAIKRWDD